MSSRLVLALVVAVPALLFTNLSSAGSPDTVDQARNLALPCEAVSTQGGISRASSDRGGRRARGDQRVDGGRARGAVGRDPAD